MTASAIFSYSIQAFGWSLLGLIVGYVMGRIDRKLDTEREQVTHTSEERGLASRRQSMSHRLTMDRNFFIGVAVLAVAVVSLVISGVNEASNRNFRNHQGRVTACQAQYNEAVVAVVAARADAAAQDRDTLDNLMKTVATATTGEQVSAALQKYIRDRKAADEQRARSPLPKPPNCKEVE